MGAMEFRVLGPQQVLDDGRPLRLGGGKQRALLALLVLHAGEVVSRDRLIEELWRGQPPAGAEITLRSHVSRLRHTLGDQRLQTQSPGYRLTIEPGELDLRRFEELVRRGRAALDRGRAGEAAHMLREALALWRGPAACDVRDELSPQPELARLEELRLVAIEDRIEADLQLGRHHELIGELEALAREHPLRERLSGQLMRALYGSGRQAEALEVYTEARGLLTEELGLEPGPELQALQQAILRQELPAGAHCGEPPHNLPAELTSFVGREQALADIAQLLSRRRLVTLTGLGGVGKSRLALQAARQAIGQLRDGVWLVELAPLHDPTPLSGALARALALPHESGSEPLAAVRRHLRSAELLLVLDNCEHLRDAVAELIEDLLSTCEGLRVLATSREHTGAPGEVIYEVPPLALPAEAASVEELDNCPPVRLFLDRAPLAGALADSDLPTVASICRELDGLPLAIELAAGRTPTLSPGEIAERLDDRFRFLRYWRRVTPVRHQTLRAAMDWSYQLLADDQQTVLRALAVFKGGFTLKTVAAVCLHGDEERALELIEGLASASLIVVDRGGGDTRYGVLETVRQYAAAQAELAGETGASQRRHAEVMLELACSANLSAEAEGAQHHAIAIAEQDNSRAALEWALRSGELELATQLAVALENFWVTHNPFEGIRWFERVLEHGERLPELLRARALRAYGSSSHIAGKHKPARMLYEQSLNIFRALGEQRASALVLHRLGMLAVDEGDQTRARRLLEEALDLARRSRTRRGEAQTLGALGDLERADGNNHLAAELFARSADLCGQLGRTWWQSNMLANLANLALEVGRTEDAAATARQILTLVAQTGDRQTALRALAILADAAAADGHPRRAGRLWGAIEAEEHRGAVGSAWSRDGDRYARSLLHHASPSLERGRDEGRRLTLSQAIELASEDSKPRPPTHPALGPRTFDRA